MGDTFELQETGHLDNMGEYIEQKPDFNFAKKKNIIRRKRGARFIHNTFSEKHQVNGVMYYLYDKGYKHAEKAHELIKQWAKSNNIDIPAERPIVSLCLEIQKDFTKFVNWYKNEIQQG